jgi:spore maturation protein CgeB
MKKVCLFNYSPIKNFNGYQIDTFDPFEYFQNDNRWGIDDLISWGLNGYRHKRALIASAAGIDRLYREKNKNYMRMVDEFVEKFRDYDLIVMSTFNFLHPEVIYKYLKNPIKVIGFIDDPYSTYKCGIPYLWAFDGAFYISPSYIDGMSFSESIKKWSNKPSTWWPLVPNKFKKHPSNDNFFTSRSIDVAYVGNPTASKVERLAKLKKVFGSQLVVHGRWPINGYYGLLRGLVGKPIYPHRVTSISNQERESLYLNTKIAFNMHVSDEASETGNMRMYETTAHGMMLLCDKATANLHEQIYEPDVEAVYYDNLDHAIDLIKYYSSNDERRAKIAKAGYLRYWSDYEWEKNMLNFLNWAMKLKA